MRTLRLALAVVIGEASSEIAFTSAMSGASCGLEGMQADRRYTFFLHDGDAGLQADLCGGTTGARDGLEQQISRWTGPPTTLVTTPGR